MHIIIIMRLSYVYISYAVDGVLCVDSRRRVVTDGRPSWRYAVTSKRQTTEQSHFRQSAPTARVTAASTCSCGRRSLRVVAVTMTTSLKSSRSAAAANRKLSASSQSTAFQFPLMIWYDMISLLYVSTGVDLAGILGGTHGERWRWVSAEWCGHGRGVPSQPTREPRGALWALPPASGAEPRPKTDFGIF